MNFQFEDDDETIAKAIMDIQDRIEYYIILQGDRIGIKNRVVTRGLPSTFFIHVTFSGQDPGRTEHYEEQVKSKV